MCSITYETFMADRYQRFILVAKPLVRLIGHLRDDQPPLRPCLSIEKLLASKASHRSLFLLGEEVSTQKLLRLSEASCEGRFRDLPRNNPCEVDCTFEATPIFETEGNYNLVRLKRIIRMPLTFSVALCHHQGSRGYDTHTHTHTQTLCKTQHLSGKNPKRQQSWKQISTNHQALSTIRFWVIVD